MRTQVVSAGRESGYSWSSPAEGAFEDGAVLRGIVSTFSPPAEVAHQDFLWGEAWRKIIFAPPAIKKEDISYLTNPKKSQNTVADWTR